MALFSQSLSSQSSGLISHRCPSKPSGQEQLQGCVCVERRGFQGQRGRQEGQGTENTIIRSLCWLEVSHSTMDAEGLETRLGRHLGTCKVILSIYLFPGSVLVPYLALYQQSPSTSPQLEVVSWKRLKSLQLYLNSPFLGFSVEWTASGGRAPPTVFHSKANFPHRGVDWASWPRSQLCS